MNNIHLQHQFITMLTYIYVYINLEVKLSNKILFKKNHEYNISTNQNT